MSTTVSRGIESFDPCPPPTRISWIESERLGPEVAAPGSFVPLARRSEPRISTLVGEMIGSPGWLSAAFALPSTRSWRNWALKRKITKLSRTQPTTARTAVLMILRSVQRLRGRFARGWRGCLGWRGAFPGGSGGSVGRARGRER